MEAPQSSFWIAIAIGGTAIASLSAFQQYSEEEFRVKPVARDFFIGAFLTAVVFMFLPESMQSWVSSGSKALSSLTGQSGSASKGQDIELQLGPARF